MILGDSRNWETERGTYPEPVRKAIDYIRSLDLGKTEVGRYDIAGDDMFALVQSVETVAPDKRKAESHIRYVDVQYVYEGDEWIGFARKTDRTEAVEDKLAEQDYALYDSLEGEITLRLSNGMFAVFFPNDLHRPACSEHGGTTIKKVVVKISLALFE